MDAAPTLWQRLWYTRWRDAIRGRFNASLDWRLVVADADLPTEVADVIGHIVGRTRLWRGEKVDVAKELIAHFQDGLAAGRTAEQLAESFGDSTAAAQLIRRAKKRGRPLIWQILRYASWTFVALAAIYFAMAAYLLMGRPSINTDYLTLINQRAASVPQDQRAWPMYRQALGQVLVERQFPKWADEPGLAPADPTWPEAVEWLKAHTAAMQLVRDAAKRPELGFPVWTTPWEFPAEDRQVLTAMASVDNEQASPVLDKAEDRMIVSTHLPQLITIRALARLLSIDTRRAAIAGDGATAQADVAAILGLSRHAEETPFLINTMVSVTIQKFAYAAIQNALSEHADLWNDAQLRDLAHAIAASQVDWRRGFEGERAVFDDVLQRMYTDDGQGNGRPVFSGFTVFRLLDAVSSPSAQPKTAFSNDIVAALAAPAATFVIASRKDMADLYNRYMDNVELQIDTPLWQPAPNPETEVLPSTKKSLFTAWRYCMVEVLAPGLQDFRKSIAARNGQQDGVLIGIALELAHRHDSRWPKSLDEIVPRYLPQLPVDRITGQPLHYMIVDDRPVVYSVGVDRDDDGGRVPVDNDGKPDADLASPKYFQFQPVTGKSHDGDWVIWSTAKSE